MAVTVTYCYPKSVAGTTTAPTALQNKGHCEVSFDLATSTDADTGAVVTHNLNVSSTTGTDGTPQVSIVPTTLGATKPQLLVAFTSKNTITLTVASPTTTVGSSASTWRVTVRRPHSITR
jgi:hypothetical protein